MSLPTVLSGIFRQKQKSYKMVLILTLLDEMGDPPREVPLSKVTKRFQQMLSYRERNNQPVDDPPPHLSNRWQTMTDQHMKQVITNPINALSKILSANFTRDRISFRPEIANQITPTVLNDLRAEAKRELEEYYSNKDQSQTSKISLRNLFSQVMSNYVKAKNQSFSGHALGKLMRQTIPEELKKLPFIKAETYKVQGSVGQGNWATVPWIAIMDRQITDTTQHGEYIVYLFSDDMKYLYLTLILGVTGPLKKGRREGEEYLRNKVRELRNMLPLENMLKDDRIMLTTSGVGRDYQTSTVAYIRYEQEKLPADEVLVSDLRNVMENYSLYVENLLDTAGGNDVDQASPESSDSIHENNDAADPMTPAEYLHHIKTFIENRGFYFPEGLIENFYLSLKTKPFVILAGISGTGKTKLIQLFAEAIGATESNGQFTLIPVRPDWSDPSDLLGYRDLSGVFKPGPLTRIFSVASQPENQDKPYFICLDEMNLARVEHYFSDLLSVMETRRWEEGKIQTVPLFESGEPIGSEEPTSVRESSLAPNHEPKDLELTHGIPEKVYIPENVYIVGTVNMDETTYPFSKKVLDRAQTIEFNEITLDTFPESLSETADFTGRSEKRGSIANDFLRSDYLVLKDAYAENEELIKRTTKRLVEINQVLEDIHAHIGFRVRDNVCFYMIYQERFQLLSEEEAFDLQLLQKILPRLQGSHSSLKRVLIKLMSIALDKGLKVEEYMEDASELYFSLKREGEAPAARYPKSARKIAYMLRRLEEDGFTSFWLS